MTKLSGETATLAQAHLSGIITQCFEHSAKLAAIVVYDKNCELARVLTEAYRHCLPDAQFIDFETIKSDDILLLFKALKPGDLAVLIQSSSFRLSAFRIRVELFSLSIKVIEHPHL